jgi:hypothetical protein
MADNKGEFTIVQSCPSVPPYATTGGRGFNMETVKSMLTNMRPGHVADVGDAYLAAANALADATTQLHQCAQRLTDVWSGKDAELALGRLRQLNVTASGLHDASLKTARTYTWLGREILPWYQNEGERMGPGYVRGPGDDQDAFEMLDRMDNRILQGYIHMPPSISKDLPPPPGDSGFQGNDNVDGGRTGSPSGDPYGLPSTGTPGAPGGQPGIDPSGHGVGVPDGAGSNLSGAGGTDLAGAGGGVGADPFGAGGLGAGGLGGGGLGGGAGRRNRQPESPARRRRWAPARGMGAEKEKRNASGRPGSPRTKTSGATTATSPRP